MMDDPVSPKKQCPATALSQDLVVEILSKLPLKLFHRFKCLSKSWLAPANSDPSSYGEKLPAAASCLFFFHDSPYLWLGVRIHHISLSPSRDDAIDAALSFLPSHKSQKMIYCCNGLLLCCSWDAEIPFPEDDGFYYYICNPATREWAAVPTPKVEYHLLAVAFDPCISRRYHILRFNPCDFEFEIFSSETREWAKTRSRWPPGVSEYQVQRGVFFDGLFYVLTLETIVGIDLGEEGQISRKIGLPPSAIKKFRRKFGSDRIGHSRGCFYYALEDIDGDIKVWTLKDYKNHDEWTLKHRISLKALFERHGVEYVPFGQRRPDSLDILAFHPDEDIVFLRVQREKVISYHLNGGGTSEEVCSMVSKYIQGFFVYSPCLLKGLLRG